MEKRSVEAIVTALNSHDVQYLIVGGLAVVAHGYVRFTADVDLILSLDEQNLSRAVGALQALGYQPRAPVPFEQFVDAKNREQWIKEKGLTVFSLFSAAHPATEIDLFVQSPLDFPKACSNAVRQEIAPGVIATFCSLEDLVALKSSAARPQDMQDIKELLHLQRKDKP